MDSPAAWPALAGVVLAASVLLVLFWAIWAPGVTTCRLTPETLVVRFSRGDVFMALRKELRISRERVRGVAVYPIEAVPRVGMKLAGASMPGVRGGVFGYAGRQPSGRSNREFWMVRRATEVMVIELQPGADYKRIVLELPDPRAAVRELRGELGALTEPLDA